MKSEPVPARIRKRIEDLRIPVVKSICDDIYHMLHKSFVLRMRRSIAVHQGCRGVVGCWRACCESISDRRYYFSPSDMGSVFVQRDYTLPPRAACRTQEPAIGQLSCADPTHSHRLAAHGTPGEISKPTPGTRIAYLILTIEVDDAAR
jgi:hypothetical protein